MSKRYRTLIGIIAIVVFGALGIWSFVKTTTPYVGFEKARAMKTKAQVLGKIDFTTCNYDEKTGVFSFVITDESGDRMRVDYSGTRPGNFEQVESIVCVGVYKDNVFNANSLLVKCPSKYQGPETSEKSKG